MKKTGTPYAAWKDDGNYDAIVIGSGIGGLGIAALLAKHADKRVLVLNATPKRAVSLTPSAARTGTGMSVSTTSVRCIARAR